MLMMMNILIFAYDDDVMMMICPARALCSFDQCGVS